MVIVVRYMGLTTVLNVELGKDMTLDVFLKNGMNIHSYLVFGKLSDQI